MKGEPSGSIHLVRVAMIRGDQGNAPISRMASYRAAHALSTASTAAFAASNTPVWPTMSQLA